MNFKSFITESADMEAINSILKKDCQPFLSEAKGLHLYRGIRNSPAGMEKLADSLYKIPVRKDRRPLLGDYEYFNTFNSLFEKKFHIPNIRSTSIVCTGNESIASAYGHEYAVYPIGDFKYTWAHDVYDALLYYKDRIKELFYVSNKSHADITKEEKEDILKKMIDKYTMSFLDIGIRSKNEVLIQCDSYYVVDLLFVNEKELI